MIIPIALLYGLCVAFQTDDKKGRNYISEGALTIFTIGVIFALLNKPYWLASCIMAYFALAASLVARHNNNKYATYNCYFIFVFGLLHAFITY